jgi:8-oxo-dGDP phosphatase
MTMTVTIDDPRLDSPQCLALGPVKTVHENPWFAVRDRGGFYSVEYNLPQVILLPIIDEDSVVMVRVKRPLIGDASLELPAGGAKADEEPIRAAARELHEETGIEISNSDRFKPLLPLSVTPRYPYLVHIFQVNLTSKEFDLRKDHDDEIACVERFSFSEVRKQIIRGQIYISLPIAVLTRYLLLHNLMLPGVP